MRIISCAKEGVITLRDATYKQPGFLNEQCSHLFHVVFHIGGEELEFGLQVVDRVTKYAGITHDDGS